tara:strand:+ start:43 stop:573 length:531 start_codon:yes stop_codon:yes gene_type:complete
MEKERLQVLHLETQHFNGFHLSIGQSILTSSSFICLKRKRKVVLLLKQTIKIKTRKETVKMKKIFYLKSCSTNQRILKELNLEGVELQNIKDENIDEKSLDFLKEKTGSYEALFSKKAMKFRSMGLNEMTLSEGDYKKYILEEYTFLKRPYMINGDEVFIGNAKNVVEAAVLSFNS